MFYSKKWRLLVGVLGLALFVSAAMVNIESAQAAPAGRNTRTRALSSLSRRTLAGPSRLTGLSALLGVRGINKGGVDKPSRSKRPWSRPTRPWASPISPW
jgi:hypothetical protein